MDYVSNVYGTKKANGRARRALRRLELDGLIRAEWGTSENNRRARYYELTRAGRRRLTSERDRWASLAAAIARVMEMNP